MPAIAFDRFYRYADLTAILEAFAAEQPDLVAIESIGKSHEGRDIWVLTVTNTATGPAAEKPAFWVDGNIHSTEVAASAANLYFLQTLVTQYGSDADVTRALDTRAFYVCPRINPDGAEWALADKPKWVRSSTRPWPWDDEEIEGLTVEDVDGDGRILQMRIADPNGLWKDHPEQPGLMVRRDPVETGGTYYRILPEGTFEGWDGFTLRVKKRKEGTRSQSKFPGELAAGIRAARRRSVPDLGARGARGRRVHRRATPTSRAASRSTRGAACCCVRSTTWPTTEMHAEDLWHYQKVGREGHRAHRLSGDLGLPRVPLSPEAGDRRRVRLDLRAPRHVQLGGRDLEPDARGGHRELPVHRLVPRPSDRATTSSSTAGARTSSAASRTSRGKPFDHPQLGRARDRRLEPLPRVRQSAAGVPRARARALSEMAGLAGADLAEDGAGRRRSRCARRRPLARSPRRPEHRLAAELRVEARARAQGRARRHRGDRAAGRARRSCTASAARSSASSKASRPSTPASRSGPTTT